MAFSKVVCIAVTLLLLSVCHANEIRKPEAPIGITFAQGHINAALRAARDKKFTGSFEGRHKMFGMTGTEEGKFSGVSRKMKSKGDFSGKSKGSVDMFGSKGRYTVGFSGKFRSAVMGKKVNWKMDGDFNFEYKGKYAGKEHYGKADGTFYGDYRNGKIYWKERGIVNVRVAGTVIKGKYVGVYKRETIYMKLNGTMDGKKFNVKWQFMLEDIEKMMKSEGTYKVVVDGKEYTGKYSGWDIIPSK